MKAQRRFGLALSWPRITTVFLLDIGVLALASHWPDKWQNVNTAWWVGVGVAALVAIIALVTYRRIPLTAVLAARMRDRFVDPEAKLAEGRTPPIDHRRRFGPDVVGVREYRGQLVAVIAVDAIDGAPEGRHSQRDELPATFPLNAVAAGLQQFDVRVDGIDIISVGTRRTSASPRGDTTVDHPAGEMRRTWLVLRMDPQRNVASLAVRDSVAATLTAAAERLAQELRGQRCTARPLTAAEFAAVDNAVLAGLQPADVLARRRRLKRKDRAEPRRYVTSFWVSPRDITSETLDHVWSPDTDATAVTIRLTQQRHGPQLSAWVRYHSAEPLSKEVCAGLNRLTGRQLAAVRASLPVPVRCSPLVVPARDVCRDEQLAVPVGCALRHSMSHAGAQS